MAFFKNRTALIASVESMIRKAPDLSKWTITIRPEGRGFEAEFKPMKIGSLAPGYIERDA